MASNDKPILVIRGDNDLVALARSALARADKTHPIITIARSEEVKHYLAAAGACGRYPVAAILRATALTLDEDSVFLLEWIQNHPDPFIAAIPVIVVSSIPIETPKVRNRVSLISFDSEQLATMIAPTPQTGVTTSRSRLGDPFTDMINQALRELGTDDLTVIRVSHDRTGCCARLRDRNGGVTAVCIEWTIAQPLSTGVRLFKDRIRALNLA